MKKLFCVCAGLAIAAAPCLAAGPSWNGTWKLNPAKSKMTGETFTIETKGKMLHFSNGTIAYDFACDGKAYTIIADRTLTCTGSPDTGYDYVTKSGDNVLSKSHHRFSADGKTMTVHGTNILPDGTTPEYTDVLKRLSGTSGLAGKWMNVKVQEAPGSFVMETNGDTFKLSFPAYKQTVEGKMDGSNIAVKGPNIPAGFTVTYKAEGANKLHYGAALNGKALDEGVQTLSADGKTIVDENWPVDKPNEKTTEVYERQ